MAEERRMRLDLEELKHLETIAKSTRILSLLSSKIGKSRRQGRALSLSLTYFFKVWKRVLLFNTFVIFASNFWKQFAKASVAVTAPASAPITQAPIVSSVLNYVALDKFSWDQDNDKIKVCAWIFLLYIFSNLPLFEMNQVMEIDPMKSFCLCWESWEIEACLLIIFHHFYRMCQKDNTANGNALR